MIRDPSDGTVRKTRGRHEPLKTKGETRENPVLAAAVSGLPTDKLRADEIERLNKSRNWLKSYFHRKPFQSNTEQTETSPRSP